MRSPKNPAPPDLRKWVVELEPGVCLAPWHGDPGRTLVRESARVYDSRHEAAQALRHARLFRAFRYAKFVEVRDA